MYERGLPERGTSVQPVTERRRSKPVPPPPSDPTLPGLSRLLDTDLVAERLAAWLTPGVSIDAVEPRQIDYAPGTHCQLAWRVWIAGQPRIAVGTMSADGSREREAGRYVVSPGNQPTGPLRRLCGVDAELQAAVHWFPYDPRMPALVRPINEVLERLGRSSAEGIGEVTDLAYRPGERAVRRIGDTVVKWYSRPQAYAGAVDGFAWAEQTVGSATARLLGVDAEQRMTLQPFVIGEGIDRDGAVAAGWDAGAMLRRLHDSEPKEYPRHRSPDVDVQQVRIDARLLSAIRPDLAARIGRLTRRLTESMPMGDTVPSHGDFNISQMVRIADGSLVVLDFDEVCAAAPAYDVASYIANVAGGRDGDAERAARVMDGILAGYGQRPDALGWYLAAVSLRRARSPFRLQKSKWPARVESGVALAEEVFHW